MIPRTLLIAASAFDALSAQRVAAAISSGLLAGGWPTEECPLEGCERPGADVSALLQALDFDTRMRRARAVVLAQQRLDERTLASSAAFEIATRARQAGVPAYAVAGENMLGAFDARILDLQVILEASTARALRSAARRLARLV
jgi:glycerate 2-kinase